jgi:hypothetical protein
MRALIFLVLIGCGTVQATPDAAVGDDDDAPLAITAVDPPLLAHGARVTITGTGFAGITSVNLAGEALVPLSMSATEIVIDPLPGTLDPGNQTLLVQRGAESAMQAVPVARMILQEVDPIPDTREFVELHLGGARGAAVTGYVLVAFDHVSGASVGAVDIAATVSSDELILMRGPGVTPTGAIPTASIIDYPAAFMPNTQGGIAVYQGSVADFPLGTPVSEIRLIDAVVYNAIDSTLPTPCNLLLKLYGSGDTCVVDEAFGDDGNLQSIGRCPGSGVARRTSSAWRVISSAVGSPGAPNDCTNLRPFMCTQPAC